VAPPTGAIANTGSTSTSLVIAATLLLTVGATSTIVARARATPSARQTIGAFVSACDLALVRWNTV